MSAEPLDIPDDLVADYNYLSSHLTAAVTELVERDRERVRKLAVDAYKAGYKHGRDAGRHEMACERVGQEEELTRLADALLDPRNVGTVMYGRWLTSILAGAKSAAS